MARQTIKINFAPGNPIPSNDLNNIGKNLAYILDENTIFSGNKTFKKVTINPTTTVEALSVGRSNTKASIKASGIDSSSQYLLIDSAGQFLSLNHYVPDNIVIGLGGGRSLFGTSTDDGVNRVQIAGSIYASGGLNTAGNITQTAGVTSLKATTVRGNILVSPKNTGSSSVAYNFTSFHTPDPTSSNDSGGFKIVIDNPAGLGSEGLAIHDISDSNAHQYAFGLRVNSIMSTYSRTGAWIFPKNLKIAQRRGSEASLEVTEVLLNLPDPTSSNDSGGLKVKAENNAGVGASGKFLLDVSDSNAHQYTFGLRVNNIDALLIDRGGNIALLKPVTIGNTVAGGGLLALASNSTDGNEVLTIHEGTGVSAFSLMTDFAGSGSAGNSIRFGSNVAGWNPNILAFNGTGRVWLGGTDNGVDKLQVNGSIYASGGITVGSGGTLITKIEWVA